MLYMIIFAVVIVISIILRVASALGLTIPLLYGLLAPTLFSEWFHANQQLAEGIGWALLGFVALTWVLSIVRKIARLAEQRREDKTAEEVFLYRLRQAKAQGIDTVSTEGLWR
jgi:hypothetical protein